MLSFASARCWMSAGSLRLRRPYQRRSVSMQEKDWIMAASAKCSQSVIRQISFVQQFDFKKMKFSC
jgi:hypothetical protein